MLSVESNAGRKIGVSCGLEAVVRRGRDHPGETLYRRRGVNDFASSFVRLLYADDMEALLAQMTAPKSLLAIAKAMLDLDAHRARRL